MNPSTSITSRNNNPIRYQTLELNNDNKALVPVREGIPLGGRSRFRLPMWNPAGNRYVYEAEVIFQEESQPSSQEENQPQPSSSNIRLHLGRLLQRPVEDLLKGTFYFNVKPERSALGCKLNHVFKENPQAQRSLLWSLLPYVFKKQPSPPLELTEYRPEIGQSTMNPDKLSLLERHRFLNLMRTPEQPIDESDEEEARLEQHAVNAPIRDSGNTLLHQAIETPDLEEPAKLALVTRLVNDFGAKVDQTNWRGETPLYLAVDQSLPGITEFLLSKNANPNMTNGEGVSIEYLSTERNHPQVRALIQQALYPASAASSSASSSSSEVERLLSNIVSENGQWGYVGEPEPYLAPPRHHRGGDWFHITDERGLFPLTYYNAQEGRQYRFLFAVPEHALWGMEKIRECLNLPLWQSSQGRKPYLYDVDATLASASDARLSPTTCALLKSWKENSALAGKKDRSLQTPEGFSSQMLTALDIAPPRPLQPLGFRETAAALVETLNLEDVDSPFHHGNAQAIYIDLNVLSDNEDDPDAPVEVIVKSTDGDRSGEAHALFRNRDDACKAVAQLRLKDHRFQLLEHGLERSINRWIEEKRVYADDEDEENNKFVFRRAGLFPGQPNQPKKLDWLNMNQSDNPPVQIDYEHSDSIQPVKLHFREQGGWQRRRQNTPSSNYQKNSTLYMAHQALKHPPVFNHQDLRMEDRFVDNMNEAGFEAVTTKRVPYHPDKQERWHWVGDNHNAVQNRQCKWVFPIQAGIKTVEDFERFMTARWYHQIDKPNLNLDLGAISFSGVSFREWMTQIKDQFRDNVAGALKDSAYKTFSNLYDHINYSNMPKLTLAGRPWLSNDHPLRKRPVSIQLHDIKIEQGEKRFEFSELEEKAPKGNPHEYVCNFIGGPKQTYSAQALINEVMRDSRDSIEKGAHDEQGNPLTQGTPMVTKEKRSWSLWGWWRRS